MTDVQHRSHAITLIEEKLDARERTLIADAVRRLDDPEHRMTEAESITAWMAVREVRKLRHALSQDLKVVQSDAARRAGA